jgi:hypothetical protein
LHDVPAGPELSALLDSIDITRCVGQQLVEVLQAQNRQLLFEQARQLVLLAELAHTPVKGDRSPLDRVDGIEAYAYQEAAFGMTWTEYTATTMVTAAVLARDTAPLLLRAMREGRLDLAKLKMLDAELVDVDHAKIPDLMQTLEPEFDRCTVAQLRDRLRTLLLQRDPQSVRERHKKAVENRFVKHDEFANGTSSLNAVYLPKEKAAAAWAHIEAIASATKAAGDPLSRDIDQIRADVFVDLLSGIDPTLAGAATPAPRKGSVHLHVDFTTLACLNDNPGAIDGFGPVAADIARQTAQQMLDIADWRFVTHDADGTVVAEGRLNYRPTLQQRRFVQARDETCRAPGCNRPAYRCEIDHVRDWAKHGPTLVQNLCLLCKRHHRAKHVGGFKIQRFSHGVRWRTPHGHHYVVLHPNAEASSSRLEVTLARHLPGPKVHIRR